MKIIGILTRTYFNKDNQSIMQIHEKTRLAFSNYPDVVCIPIIPTQDVDYNNLKPGEDIIDTNKLDYILNLCDAFLLPGGTNFYQIDEYVIKHAVKYDKPLLGICLGFQAICSAYAKNRTKFTMNTIIGNESHKGPTDKYIHSVNIKDNTLLKSIVKESTINVNSSHISKVDFEMNELVVNAISNDGIIEGVEKPNNKFILGVQWHPEHIKDVYSEKLFDRFINSITK